MSVKVSTAMNNAKTIQYIIHRTWAGGGQRPTAKPAEPAPLSQTDPEIPDSLSCCILLAPGWP